MRYIKLLWKLLRLHHWIKNLLVFFPLFFSINLFDISLVTNAVLGFVFFSLASSIIYIFNDIRDIEKDRLHAVKRNRPLASGAIPVRNAVISAAVLSLVLITSLVVSVIFLPLFGFMPTGLLLLYILVNLGYSLGLKNIPIIDIAILAAGYVIRVFFGALIVGVEVSVWLYLVIITAAFYLGMGKRRNEIIGNESGKRESTPFYSVNFLDKNMYVCLTLCVVFYALWSIDTVIVYTIPLVIIILLKYSLNIEKNKDTDGDPVSVLLKDKILLLLCGIYIICLFCIVYINILI